MAELLGVFLTSSSSLIGASLDDLTRLVLDMPFLTVPLPMMEIGRGWKSNCLIKSIAYARNVALELGQKDI